MRRLLVCLTLLAATARAEEAPVLLIQAVGDLNLAGSAESVMREKGYGWAFDGTRALLSEADLNVANLETPVTTRRTPSDKRFTYRMHPSALVAIRDAGFELVSLANNHTLDQGAGGLHDTLAHLRERGIQWAGAGSDIAAAREPAIVEKRGVKVGFLSYSCTFPESFWATATTPGTAFCHEHWMVEDVARLRAQVDLVLVAYHWGAEKMETPKDYQKQLAHAAIAAGADAVIGHHPHVLQGVEVVDGKPVLYSLGNYAFGSRSDAAKDSALARLVVRGKKIERLEMIPLNVHNRFVEFNPRVADGEVRERILQTLERLSSDLGARGTREDGRWVVDLRGAPAVAVESSAESTGEASGAVASSDEDAAGASEAADASAGAVAPPEAVGAGK